MSALTRLSVGSEIWFDSEIWTVAELGSKSVQLMRGPHLRRVATDLVLNHAKIIDDGPASTTASDHEPANLALTNLTAQQHKKLDKRAALVRSLLASDSSGSMSDRQAAAAEQAGVTKRTVQRWLAAYRELGVVGLADSSLTGHYSPVVDPRWDKACIDVLDSFVSRSTPSKSAVIDLIERRLRETYGVDVVRSPSRSTAYRRLEALAKGRHAFGDSKQRRSVANRPNPPYGRLRATRPGEYVVLDTTPLDVFAIEPVTKTWVRVELTVAQDLYTRCILGLRLSPVAAKAADVANVLYQCVVPQPEPSDDGTWPFHGVPGNVLIGTEVPDGLHQQRVAGLPACLPEAIVVDHGKTYLSNHVISACARLGITIQPAVPYKPTDKPTVERFFKTLRQGLLQHLPSYKGPDVASRGDRVERHALYFVSELEQIIREWVGTIYHHTRHNGLTIPEVPGIQLSPAEAFEIGLVRAGGLLIPRDPDLAFWFLDVHWRTIQHYGVEIRSLRYDGPVLNLFRNQRSHYGGPNAGKWPIYVDVHDVRRVWFQNPSDGVFEPLEWEHAPGLNQPFSREAVEYARRVAMRSNQNIDVRAALERLLDEWKKDLLESRRDKNLARRLGSAPSGPRARAEEERTPRDRPPEARVQDVLSKRRRGRTTRKNDADVFIYFMAQNPNGTMEVFDE